MVVVVIDKVRPCWSLLITVWVSVSEFVRPRPKLVCRLLLFKVSEARLEFEVVEGDLGTW